MRLESVAESLQSEGGKALVAFLTAGFPDEDTFIELVRAAGRSGCTAIEIGIPFSDPIADGPLIQYTSQVALDGGMTLRRALELMSGLQREVAAPLIFMGYYNPVLRMGPETFADASADAGVAGVIVPDLSFEESVAVRPLFHERGIAFIDLIAPTSSDTRIGRIVPVSRGFVYLVSVAGVTGMNSPRARELEAFVGRVRPHTEKPLYVGFGISDADKARDAVAAADGVIIGSALVRLIRGAGSKTEAVERVETFLRNVATAIQPAGGKQEAGNRA